LPSALMEKRWQRGAVRIPLESQWREAI